MIKWLFLGASEENLCWDSQVQMKKKTAETMRNNQSWKVLNWVNGSYFPDIVNSYQTLRKRENKHAEPLSLSLLTSNQKLEEKIMKTDINPHVITRSTYIFTPNSNVR